MEPFKNNFSAQLISTLCDHLAAHVQDFDRAGFEAGITHALDKLELKQRIQLIADQLHRVLPVQHDERHRILLALLHPEGGSGVSAQSDAQGIRGWGTLPLCAVIGQYGLPCFEASLETLKQMTSHFSSEFDVRYFLLEDQSRALKIMANWIHDPNHHVRRLVSEGTRPRLPWAMKLPKLIADPTPILPLLEALRDDEEDYVRRSVANHLNDIAKDHPDLVADLAQSWMVGTDKNRKRLLRHACRSLIKAGHPKALEIFGYQKPQITLHVLDIANPRLAFGTCLNFAILIQSTSNISQPLMIDYVIHFLKSNGSLSPKVFKWKTLSLAPHEKLSLKRAHAIRPITTRKYYPGQQAISLRINGQDFGWADFHLDCQEPPQQRKST